MSDGISIDMSEINSLVADMGRVKSRVMPEVEKVAKKGAQNLKEEYRSQASSSFWFKGMASSISYDRLPSIRGVTYEIGPDKDRRGGPLGNIFFFGGAHGGGGSGDLNGPLESEGDAFAKSLGEVIADRMLGQ